MSHAARERLENVCQGWNGFICQCAQGVMQEVLEAAMDIIGERKVRELVVQLSEAGVIQADWIGGREFALEDIFVLRSAAFGEENLHFFNKKLFQ